MPDHRGDGLAQSLLERCAGPPREGLEGAPHVRHPVVGVVGGGGESAPARLHGQPREAEDRVDDLADGDLPSRAGVEHAAGHLGLSARLEVEVDEVLDVHPVAGDVGVRERDGRPAERSRDHLRDEPARVVVRPVDRERSQDHDGSPPRAGRRLRVKGRPELGDAVQGVGPADVGLAHRLGARPVLEGIARGHQAEVIHAVAGVDDIHGAEEVQGDHVRIDRGGARDDGGGGEVEDVVRPGSLHHVPDLLAVEQARRVDVDITEDVANPPRVRTRPAERVHGVAVPHQAPHEVRPHKAGGSGHERGRHGRVVRIAISREEPGDGLSAITRATGGSVVDRRTPR